ncbi:sialidase family protein [Anaerocolumna sp. MB42-C2]|uniref:sialidase family protein n=1 Tax=Anaerocolumna sp. MB42-C2 TaxID=3070997 RepID=UPI0027E0F77B|nr:sialidase family protein [Anaerocolumna sp. MB42-C2]WMJ85784.1 sialidase family protein [Anaerocolumna sp. MB42-C2]
MEREYINIDIIEESGKLYKNALMDTVESRIPNTPYKSCHAADLLELPNGDLLCCWFAGTDEGNADVSIVLSRLNAGSSVWTDPVKVSDDPTRSEQNPSLFLTPEGYIWIMYTAQTARTPETETGFNLQYTAEIRRKISKDNGYTWGQTEVMFNRPGSFCRQKIQILSNGRYIFGNWICFSDDSRNGSDITVMQISDDKGKSWREVSVPKSQGRVHANVIETEPGKLTALFRSRFADFIYLSKSEDNGENWSEPIRTELPNNNSSISAIKLKSGAIGLVYNPVSFNEDTTRTVWPDQRCPVTLAISEDGGMTWPYRRIVELGEGFCGKWNDINNGRYEYPVMMQDNIGKIHVAYSWGNLKFGKRKCIKYVCVDEKWIRGDEFSFGAENDPSMPCRR